MILSKNTGATRVKKNNNCLVKKNGVSKLCKNEKNRCIPQYLLLSTMNKIPHSRV